MGKSNKKYIFSPLVNLILYDLLLIAAPFLMLQNYLQKSIRDLSEVSLELFGVEIPVLVFTAAVALIALIIYLFRRITLTRLLFSGVVLVMIAIGQWTADFYMAHSFYDLQNNWHYFAYGLFSFVMYRYVNSHNLPLQKTILIIFLKAAALSTFDEGAQVFLSDRIFDICDIAKDMWGALMGIIIVFLIVREGKDFKSRKFRRRKLKDYLRFPSSVLVLGVVFSYIWLLIASSLTETEYIVEAVALTVIVFILVFFILHLSQFKVFQYFFTGLAIVLIILFIWRVSSYEKQVKYESPGVTSYKGVPILYFDFIIFPSGGFRIVDKKEFFYKGDRYVLYRRKADILLIGSGPNGEGGQGFEGTQFVENKYFLYNPIANAGMQVLIFETPEACKVYNRLKSEGKKVLFIVHNY